MPENVEIKARARNFPAQLKIAEAVSNTKVEIIQQKDTFFVVQHGRLKLREFDENRGELISYFRDDIESAKHSTYKIYPTSEPRRLLETLSVSLRVIGAVEKTRRLYFHGQTRIHLDDVKNLGHFIELEYVLAKDEDRGNGRNTIRNLMQTLEIAEHDLISHAYIDLLLSV